jgi:acyl carrier protein
MTTSAAAPTRAQVAAVVREFLGQELKITPSDITDDAVLKELPGADSVRLVRVVSRLERHWDREFDDDQVFDLHKFDDLVGLTHSYLNDGNG